MTKAYKDLVEQFWKQQTLKTKIDHLEKHYIFQKRFITMIRISFNCKEKFYIKNHEETK